MFSRILLLFSLFIGDVVQSQDLEFRTIVRSPVVVGESFSVQYVIRDEGPEQFTLPFFHGFRVVSGPSVYTSAIPGISQSRQVKNFVVTLVSNLPGRHRIPGATVSVNGKKYRSNDNFIEVMPKPPVKPRDNSTDESASYLRPGEDVNRKLKENLFVKVLVDRRKCYVGQPVTATFKLYSRLESKSEIVKNPGFYGFTVYDDVTLNDHQVNSETVNGKIFDVHTIRRVQLYPLRAGVFAIDPMQILNRVEFSRSMLSRHAGQEITEGVLHPQEMQQPDEGTVIAQNEISTEEIPIVVEPLPEKGQPGSFTGAVGNFSLHVRVKKSVLERNENGSLEIAVRGTGNFSQINPPTVKWPSGVEGFDVSVSDSLETAGRDLHGTRYFRYAFVASGTDSFKLPEVRMAFFNPDTGRYTELIGPALSVKVYEAGKKTVAPSPAGKNSKSYFWILAVAVAVACLAALPVFLRSRGRKKVPPAIAVPEETLPEYLNALLRDADMEGGNRAFYTSIHQITWKFLSRRFGVTGGNSNKLGLRAMISEAAGADTTEKVITILEECEAGMYTDATLAPARHQLLLNLREALLKLA